MARWTARHCQHRTPSRRRLRSTSRRATPSKQAICEVWQEVLNREQIGVEDNFFSLGGDSILSIRVVAMLQERGVSIEVKDIFQHQTVAQLALQARDTSAATEEPELEPFALLTEEERSRARVTSTRTPTRCRRCRPAWSSTPSSNSSAASTTTWWPSTYAARGTRSASRGRWPPVYTEHPVLRTGFLLDRERPLQVVHRSIELPLEVADLRGQSAEEQEQYLAEWMERHKRHVFDWERGPLFQVHIFLRTDDSFQFVLSFHHSVLDGWSRAVLTTELYNRYERLLSGGELEEAEVDWTYRDFVAQEQRAVEETAAGQYFRRMLEDAPAQRLPAAQGRRWREVAGALPGRRFHPALRPV